MFRLQESPLLGRYRRYLNPWGHRICALGQRPSINGLPEPAQKALDIFIESAKICPYKNKNTDASFGLALTGDSPDVIFEGESDLLQIPCRCSMEVNSAMHGN